MSISATQLLISAVYECITRYPAYDLFCINITDQQLVLNEAFTPKPDFVAKYTAAKQGDFDSLLKSALDTVKDRYANGMDTEYGSYLRAVSHKILHTIWSKVNDKYVLGENLRLIFDQNDPFDNNDFFSGSKFSKIMGQSVLHGSSNGLISVDGDFNQMALVKVPDTFGCQHLNKLKAAIDKIDDPAYGEGILVLPMFMPAYHEASTSTAGPILHAFDNLVVSFEEAANAYIDHVENGPSDTEFALPIYAASVRVHVYGFLDQLIELYNPNWTK